MRFSLTKFHLYWIGIWTLVLIYIFVADAVLSKKVSYTKVFSQNQYGISYVFPLGRTEVTDMWQRFVGEPVYTTVYAPRLYNKAEIELSFEESPVGWSFGVQNGPGFSYIRYPLEETLEHFFVFDIESSITEQNRLRFIFTNDQDFFEPLTLSRLSITLSESRESYIQTYTTNGTGHLCTSYNHSLDHFGKLVYRYTYCYLLWSL